MHRLLTSSDIQSGFQHIEKEEIQIHGIRRLLLVGCAGCTGFHEDSRTILGQLLGNSADLIIFLGDLAFTGAEEEFQEFIAFCNNRVQVPIFSLCGNHDLLHYNKYLGLATYALVLDEYVCLFLSNPLGHCSDEDLAFLAGSLKKYGDKQVIILMHIPPPTDIHRGHISQNEWERLRAVLDPHRQNISHIFCGHIHGFHEYQIDGYQVTISAGGGAAMIYDLKKPARKIYHAIAMDLSTNGRVTTELLLAEDIAAS